MADYEIFNIGLDVVKIHDVAEFAKLVWHETYDELLPQGQVDYMILKFQSVNVIANDIKNNDYVYYVAQKGDKICGYCAVRPEKVWRTIFLSKIYVRSTERGKGIARSFINRVIKDFGDENYDLMYLTVNRYNSRAIEAYRRLGFSITETMDTPIGGGYEMNDYKMERKI